MPDIVATRQQLAAQQQKPVKQEADVPQSNGDEAPPQPAAAAVDAMEVGLSAVFLLCYSDIISLHYIDQ